MYKLIQRNIFFRGHGISSSSCSEQCLSITTHLYGVPSSGNESSTSADFASGSSPTCFQNGLIVGFSSVSELNLM
jgi:hypothetical protein